ncbi:autotransporter outer membrane beta-barrel domain-containing protein [Buttiauxella sp. WJP83]|uniref:autotransporter family protein n=1 Tax=Buttiauxella sp. WJP83 TaxID=2986951 RepID=UPI0022DD1AC6|nr:autotransporter outer membrane beta-barrel domain-containing protein [Buttiauxella sp. WJP83]WBM72691.1 autotransporter outer membrane beta-barrel domain-containing protein [Buttiauxella sp. WJP83]
MKIVTPYLWHTQKLALASLISVAVGNYAHAEDLDYSNYYPSAVGVNVSDEVLNITADNAWFEKGLNVTNNAGDINVEMTNSAVSDKSGLNNAKVILVSYTGNITAVFNNIEASASNIENNVDSAIYVNALIKNADTTINNSPNLNRPVTVFGGNLILKVNNSSLGMGQKDLPSDIPIIAAGAAVVGGISEVDISNTELLGNVVSLGYMGKGINIITLNNGTFLTGNITEQGINNTLNLDNATVTGAVTMGAYTNADTVTSSTINLSNGTYRNNITSAVVNGVNTDDSLTVNVNNGAMIGGETAETSQKITGFDHVDFNINYVDPSLVNTGKASYFFFNEGEQVAIANSINGRYIADTVRTGSYVLDRIGYTVTTDPAKTGYYSIVFDANEMPPTPLKPPSPPEPPAPPEPTPPAPAPKTPAIAADLQAAQAGLLASDEMIHHIANSITQHLDARHMAENGAQTSASNVWLDGIYSGGDRTAGATEYSNDISGFQLGADTAFLLSNGDTLAIGAGLGYLHNDLDVTSSDSSNDIKGNYYSLYAGWTQNQPEGKNWHLFADTTATYGDMSYSASGKDGKLSAGSDYDGQSWLWQARLGAQVNLTNDWWIQPYSVLGYSQTKTDGYSDGYSHVADGKYKAGFAGGGAKAGKTFTLKGGQTLRPYVEASYVGRFSEDTQFKTSDYSFDGQNLNGGNIGTGLNVSFTKNLSATAKVNTLIASDVKNEVSGYLGVAYEF